MRTADLVRTDTPPAIDGVLDEPVYRLNAERLAAEIAASAGGSIELVEQQKKGACVRLMLPAG